MKSILEQVEESGEIFINVMKKTAEFLKREVSFKEIPKNWETIDFELSGIPLTLAWQESALGAFNEEVIYGKWPVPEFILYKYKYHAGNRYTPPEHEDIEVLKSTDLFLIIKKSFEIVNSVETDNAIEAACMIFDPVEKESL